MVVIVKKQSAIAPLLEGLGAGIQAWGQKNIKRQEQEKYKNLLVKSGMDADKAAAIAFAPDAKIAGELLKQERYSGHNDEYQNILNEGKPGYVPKVPRQSGTVAQASGSQVAATETTPIIQALESLGAQQPAQQEDQLLTGQQPAQQPQEALEQFPANESLSMSLDKLIQNKQDYLLRGTPFERKSQSQVQPAQQPVQQQASQPSVSGQEAIASEVDVPEKKITTFNDLAQERRDEVRRFSKMANRADSYGDTKRADGFRASAKTALEESKQYMEDEKEKDNFNKDYIKEITATSRGAKLQNETVQQQIELKKKGLLPSQANEIMASAIGKLIPGLKEYVQKSPGAEFFNKLNASQLKGIRNMFGSKITEREMVYFMQQFPSLKMTPQGMEMMGKFFNLAEQKSLLRSSMMKEKLKDSSVGKYDLEEAVEDAISEKMKTLPGQAELDNYVKELYKNSPEGRKEAAAAQAQKAAEVAKAKVPVGQDMGSAKGWPEGKIIPGEGGRRDIINKGDRWITM